MEHAHWRFGTMHSHVRLEVAFSGESSTADLAFEWPFTCVRTVMHLQGALAAQDPITDDAFIWIC